ncbi:PfkB family carbohydrate kinase [Deinococcus maricopensis]|uniref:PfkB domain protein n=1 Tax=Deinococcus maricopensis (strain DSM 21211 / LMG 22137 / NRRL B-23946 / LB-34) TaxID=709986 RepID=E8U305_DEIML|nr:PfkB family carbohydrate kinase [Deinococcus maricopensis]ADV65743.1 PfkB domain protein [Deinococcus maricopensis DSM 21211]
MRRLLGLGDNTVDLYLASNTMYPGGNAVNVAVLTARLGHDASYLGTVGDDPAGHLLLNALRAERVDTTRTRQVPGTTSWSRVLHQGNDRHFDGSDAGVSTQWTFTDEDDAFIAEHRMVHSSIYSGLDAHLPRIRAHAPLLSFDFSSEWTDDALQRTAPHLDVAFLSAAHQPHAACVDLGRHLVRLGPAVVVLTRGDQGALAVTHDSVHDVGVLPADIVDTLGAGDAFITGFLNSWYDERDVPLALHDAATQAARNCATLGAFGHGTPIPPA